MLEMQSLRRRAAGRGYARHQPEPVSGREMVAFPVKSAVESKDSRIKGFTGVWGGLIYQ